MRRSGLLALLCGMVVAEGLVRFLADGDLLDDVLRRLGPHGERLAAYDDIYGLRGAGALSPLVVSDPELGFLPRPGTQTRPTYTATVSEDHARITPASADPSALRVAVYGDSYTFGYEVEDDVAYPAQVAAQVPQWTVLNRSVPGYGHDQALLRFEREVGTLALDGVIFGITSTDMERNVRSFYGYEKPWFELRDGELTLHGQPVPDQTAWLSQRRWTPRIWDLLRALAERGDTQAADRSYRTDLAEALMQRFVDTAGEHDLPVALVWLPDGRQVHNAAPSQVPVLEAMARVCARDERVRCIDAAGAFAEAVAAGQDVRGPTHWSPEGHRAVAHAIVADATRSGWPAR